MTGEPFSGELPGDEDLLLACSLAVVPITRFGRRLSTWLDFVAGTQGLVAVTRRGRLGAVLYDSVARVPMQQTMRVRDDACPVRVAFSERDKAFAAWMAARPTEYATGPSLKDALRALLGLTSLQPANVLPSEESSASDRSGPEHHDD